jgi:hypothetical protein
MLTAIKILFCHFLGDWVFQPTWISANKWNNIFVLGTHGVLYGLPFLPFFGWKFAVFNGVAHAMVDGITSQFTHYAYSNNNAQLFIFVVILDQLFHVAFLYQSLRWLD